MQAYEFYEVEDFASDDAFIAWCLCPDDESIAFWENWIQTHPHKRLLILEARQLVLDLQVVEQEDEQISFEQEIWEGIHAKIEEREIRKRPKLVALVLPFSIAASLLLAVGLFWLNTFNVPSDTSISKSDWVNFENDSGITKTILLSDSSLVKLEPFSSLKYPREFLGEQRMVFLKGEAFFEVTHDTLHPFLVYANETITKVLGTSFVIHAFEGKSTVEVEVKTGKVAVYAQVASKQNKAKEIVIQTDENIRVPKPNKKLEVTPNQKVVFDKTEEVMKKTVSEKATPIAKIETLPQLRFEDAAVSKVFSALETAYGIDLEYDEEQLKDCTITTKLKDEPLLQKLDIICKALDLKFTESDARIFIKGNGC